MKPVKKATETKVRKKKTQDDLTSAAKPEDKVKKSVYSVTTPRNYVPKSSTADIYARKKPAPQKKMVATPRTNDSPMKDLLKSSPSTVSQISSRSSKPKMADLKNTTHHATSRVTPRKSALTNVTVNSPVVKRRLNLDIGKDIPVKKGNDKTEASASKYPSKDTLPGRQRTKTRTLEDDEVKILTPEAIDNNAAMQDLSRKLTAKPKAFYVDLEEKPRPVKVETKKNSKSSEEDEVSYEDDFESYESDFDSYHSEAKSDETSTRSQETSEADSDDTAHKSDRGDESEEANSKELKDEEKMLDSGNFDLRDSQRSASRKPALMDFITEGAEDQTDDKKVSLTDEGFQEMSSSSAVSSMKMVHIEVLERPLFIDFKQSKENKRKRKIFEKLKQRAKDILSMVTLHEMTYSLFEMKPIPYDLYMATFGRKNYTQIAIQTFEDGITQEIQTDDILHNNKWSQIPVEFSTNDIITKIDESDKKHDVKEETLWNFDYLINPDRDKNNITVNEEYRSNPLRIYLEQKEGAGNNKMMPEDIYEAKLKNKDYNVIKLRKFLKKTERRLSSILSLNAGTETLELIKNSNVPFSEGYLNISTKNISDEKLHFLKYTKIAGVCLSETKESLVLTYHKKSSNNETIAQYFICLWDTSVLTSDPFKVLKATDNVHIGRFRGNTNGIFAAALEDRTLQIWDLSEEPTWRNDVASMGDGKTTKLVEVDKSQMSEVETDREWNLRNSQVGFEEKPQSIIQVSAYTNSGVNMTSKTSVDNIVGLEFIGEQRETIQDGGRKIVGKICTLQKLGILIIWSITQEKLTTHDIGKAYWSKIKLEKNYILNLSEHLDTCDSEIENCFNLNAAKRRLANRKQERAERRKDLTRPRSAILKNIDRPSSVASPRRNLPISKDLDSWDSIVCNHMKVLRLSKTDHYLVAGMNGQVFCCKRSLNDFKIDRLCVASEKSPITRLEVTYSNLPYFLAATDSGTINLCSILEARVLLTLDCRNGPPVTTVKCQADHKGRFIASVPQPSPTEDTMSGYQSNGSTLSVRSVSWSPINPFCIVAVVASGTVVTWELTHSDINARSALDCAAVEATSSRCSYLALLTKEGEVQIHRLLSEYNDKSSMDLFKKYVALL